MAATFSPDQPKRFGTGGALLRRSLRTAGKVTAKLSGHPPVVSLGVPRRLLQIEVGKERIV